jgi:hypothetical protein
LAQGLDILERLRYYVCGLPVSVLRHPPARVSVRRRKKLAALHSQQASFFARSAPHFWQGIRRVFPAVPLA